MPDRTMNLYFIQSPDVMPDDPEGDPEGNNKGYLRDLLKAYPSSVPIRDVKEFVGRVLLTYFQERTLVKSMIIGSHGAGTEDGTGRFYIGATAIARGHYYTEDLNRLMTIAPVFARDADVYLMACRTGRDEALLRKVSQVLGGVRVHGYTEFLMTQSWGPFGSVSGQEYNAKHIVCWPSRCSFDIPLQKQLKIYSSNNIRPR